MASFDVSAAGLPQLQSNLQTPMDYSQQYMKNDLANQQSQAQTATIQNELQNKQRQMQISMLSGVLTEPDPEKQKAILSNLVPTVNKINPNYQIDPNIDIPTLRALVQSTHPIDNLPPSGLNLDGLPPMIKAGIQSGQLSMKDILGAQAANPFLNVGGDTGVLPTPNPTLNAAPAGSTMNDVVKAGNPEPVDIGAEKMHQATPVFETPPDVAARLSQLPITMQPTVKAIVEGRELPPTLNSRSPGAQSIMQAVNFVDPSFDFSNAQNRAKTRASFTSGDDSKNITAINTAIPHLIALKQAYDNLGNTSVPAVNAILNFSGNQTGIGGTQAKTAAVSTDAAAVAHELAKVFRNTGMSEAEIKDWQDKISTNASPEQSDAVIQSALDLMDGRLQALGNKYSQGMMVAKDGIDLISPTARAAYQKLRSSEPITAATQTSMAIGGKSNAQSYNSIDDVGKALQSGQITPAYAQALWAKMGVK
jgi:hypothetical protein